MAEEISGRKIFSLLEVAKSIQKTISDRYKSSYWIKAEMNKLNYYPHSGHCYPDLVEKSGGKVIAQIRANIWSDDYQKISAEFLRILKEPLKDGIKILFLAHITFRPEYGLALRIIDIDPAFTLGDLEKEKQETITRLQQEGMFDKNKFLKLALMPQRIAVISVQTSKGYADFLEVLGSAGKNYGFRFFYMLFPSLLQGEKAVSAIIGQLRRIRKVARHFDVVAIIRGGGGDIGLSCYNHYQLAKEITLFPLPVITGIGHATNETVTEMVAFENAITPTHLAEFLVGKFGEFQNRIVEAHDRIAERTIRIVREEKVMLGSETKLLRSVTMNLLNLNRYRLSGHILSLSHQPRYIFRRRREALALIRKDFGKWTCTCVNHQKLILDQQRSGLKRNSAFSTDRSGISLDNLEKRLAILDPKNVLKRGYSITLLKGKAIRSIEQVTEGDILETIVFKGKIESIVQSKKKKSDE
jgi:exodeoxyribonuclease VII large subunit